MYEKYVQDTLGIKQIKTIKYSTIYSFYCNLIDNLGFKPNSMETIHTILHPVFRLAGCIVTKLKHDLVGMEFGHLLVLERTYDRRFVSKDTRWKCLCQNCGRTVSVGSRNLRSGNPYGHCKCTRNKKQKNGVQN